MRTWSIVSKYAVQDNAGVITHTDVTIVSTSNGYAIYTERILGDQRLKTDQELIELARDAYFKREYADRAMAESVQVIDELKIKSVEFGKQIADAKIEIEALKTEIVAEIKGETEKNREMVRIVTLTVNELLSQLTEGEEEEVEDAEPINIEIEE